MTAKEMFEQLGYKLLSKSKLFSPIINFIEYRKEEIIDNLCVEEVKILFDNRKKVYKVETKSNYVVDSALHKVITKQLEELGWLEN